MDTTTRQKIDNAAREAAIASWDAHGGFVSADEAYAFIREMLVEDDDEVLPATRPAEFRHDYERYCRLIRERNPFMVSDLTRPA